MGRVRRGGKPNRTARPRGINISSQPVCARLTASRITITDLGDNDELTGEDVIPGFRVRVGELFEGMEPAPVAANGPQA